MTGGQSNVHVQFCICRCKMPYGHIHIVEIDEACWMQCPPVDLEGSKLTLDGPEPIKSSSIYS